MGELRTDQAHQLQKVVVSQGHPLVKVHHQVRCTILYQLELDADRIEESCITNAATSVTFCVLIILRA